MAELPSIEFVPTTKGGVSLLCGPFKFRFNMRRNDGGRYWKCSQPYCRATAITDANNRLVKVGEHSHPPLQHNHPTLQHSHPTLQHSHPTLQHSHPTLQHSHPPLLHNLPPMPAMLRPQEIVPDIKPRAVEDVAPVPWICKEEGANGSSNEDRSGDGASTTEESMLGPDLMAPPETEQAVSPNPTTPGQQKPESYQLRHNNHMTLVLESLAQDEAFMDVTLTAQGRSIRAHKSVLSAVSPYFRGVLCENPCQHPIIIMPRDVRFDELQSIITYIYKGEMTVAAEDLSSLLKTAEILQVTGLTPADPQAASAAAAASFNPQISSTFTSPETPRTSNTKTYQTQQKSQDSINPTDFMDMDMTCVKEEVMSGDEDGDEDEQDSASYPPSQFTPHSQGNEPQPTTTNQTSSSSSMTTTTPSAQTRYSSDADVNPDPCTSPSKDEEDLISCQVPMSREDPEPFVCPHCKEIARGFEALTLHLKTKHPSKLSFPCRCGRVYLRHGRYVDHTKFCNTGSS